MKTCYGNRDARVVKGSHEKKSDVYFGRSYHWAAMPWEHYALASVSNIHLQGVKSHVWLICSSQSNPVKMFGNCTDAPVSLTTQLAGSPRVVESPCTVTSTSMITCQSFEADWQANASIAVARNGQNFVMLKSEVWELLCISCSLVCLRHGGACLRVTQRSMWYIICHKNNVQSDACRYPFNILVNLS